MRRSPWFAFLAAVLLCAALFADSIRMYLKDGTFQMVREYKVDGDRVSYYSVERSDWEEVPLNLVDLTRTEGERRAAIERNKKQREAENAEDKFEADQAKEASLIPAASGVYLLDNGKVQTFKLAESTIVNNKKRSVLKYLSPIPLVIGKATIEVAGLHSANVVPDQRPTFWFRPDKPERFAIVKCEPKKDSRIVERWYKAPQSEEVAEDRVEVEIFRQQIEDGLYKIWPQKPLEPGEYAVIEFTEGEHNTQIWDFRVEARSN
jgi:hypothetical protein